MKKPQQVQSGLRKKEKKQKQKHVIKLRLLMEQYKFTMKSNRLRLWEIMKVLGKIT